MSEEIPKMLVSKKKSFTNAIAAFCHQEMESSWGVKRISQVEKRCPWVASYKQDSVSTSWIRTARRSQMSPIACGAQTQHCAGLALSKEERVPLRLTPQSPLGSWQRTWQWLRVQNTFSAYGQEARSRLKSAWLQTHSHTAPSRFASRQWSVTG